MAIQKSMTINGETFASAYHVVRHVIIGAASGNRLAGAVEFRIDSYKTAAERSKSDESNALPPYMQWDAIIRDTDDSATYFADSVLAADTKSPIGQAYTWLKTQDATSEGGLNWTTGTTDV